VTRLWVEGQPIKVWGEGGSPEGFLWDEEPQRVTEVCNHWRVHTRWWEPEQAVWREYWKVITEAGVLCLIYRDLQLGGWFLARVYD